MLFRLGRALLSPAFLLFSAGAILASPPAVGIISNSRSCLACHVSNGSWVEGPDLVIDLLEQSTMKSLRQPDGSYLLTCKRGEAKTVMTVIGYRTANREPAPYRNGWICLDTTTIGNSSLSKFLPGWEINLPYGCRIVGDKLEAYSGAPLTSAPMTIRPTAAAHDGSVTLQVMLTTGESVKGNAKAGLTGNYHQRILHLRVVE